MVAPKSDEPGGGQRHPSAPPSPVISIPDIRDYQRINDELVRLLDEGHPLIRLEGAEGQRLLASGLSGRWQARVVIEGNVGPDVASGLDAPGLTVEVTGRSADASGHSLRSGTLILRGATGDGLGYHQLGGTIVALADAGHRAGLMRCGGVLAILGSCGRLLAERQSGGVVFARRSVVGPNAGHAPRGGRLVLLPDGPDLSSLDPEDARLLERFLRDSGE